MVDGLERTVLILEHEDGFGDRLVGALKETDVEWGGGFAIYEGDPKASENYASPESFARAIREDGKSYDAVVLQDTGDHTLGDYALALSKAEVDKSRIFVVLGEEVDDHDLSITAEAAHADTGFLYDRIGSFSEVALALADYMSGKAASTAEHRHSIEDLGPGTVGPLE